MAKNPLSPMPETVQLAKCVVYKTKWQINGAAVLIALPKLEGEVEPERQAKLGKANEFFSHLNNVLQNMTAATATPKAEASPKAEVKNEVGG